MAGLGLGPLGLGFARSTGDGGGAVEAPTGTATMTQISTNDTKRVYQRSTTSGGGQGKGQGTIPLTISSALAGALNARCRAEDGVTILQAEWVAATITGGATTANIAGVDARLGWFYLDIKDVSGSWQNGTTLIGMGALFGFAGQSLMARMFGRQDGQTATYVSLGITPNPNSSVLATYNETNAYMPTVATMPWQTPGDVGNSNGPNSVGVGEYLNRMIAMLGVNCGAIGHSQGGTGIGTYYTGQSNWTQLSSVLSRAGGAFEGFNWGQGHTNASQSAPEGAYISALTTVFAQITAANTFAGYFKTIWTIPAISSTAFGTADGHATIRRAAEAWCDANSATYVHANDIAQTDGTHQSQAGSITMARHMYRAVRPVYGQTAGIGPEIISATRSGTTITATLSDVGQTNLSLVGTPANRLFVFSTGRVNRISAVNDNRFPISTVTVTNATTLSIVLANDPGDGHELDLYAYWPSGPSDATTDNIYDDRTDADGIVTGRILAANHNKVVIAPPVPAGAVNAPPGGYVAAVSRMNMTETTPVYAAGAAGFGSEMTSGRASQTAGTAFAPLTFELFFVCPTIPASLQVLAGAGAEFMGINAAGKVECSGITGATTLVAGKRYHAAFVAGPTGKRLYLTNITDGGAGIRDANNTTPVTKRVDSVGYSIRFYSGSFILTGGAVDEVAIWFGEKYTGTSYTAPTVPYVGTEADLVYLYHLDGDATEVATA